MGVIKELDSEKISLVLAQAENRNRSIPRILKGKIPYDRTMAATILARATCLLYLPNIYVEGLENLSRVRDTLVKGEKVIGISTHKADGDSIGIREALIRSGYSDLAEITGFPAGLKMWERFYIRPFVECISAFPILTPADEENIENLLENQDRYGLGIQAIDTVKKYKDNGISLRMKSGLAMRRFTKAGNLLIVYVETTRSRTNSQLQPAREEVLEYFRMNNLWILPIEVHGIEKINPPEEPFHWLERTDAFVTFGRPFQASWLHKCQLPETLAGRAVRRADLLTLELANLNRLMVDPEDMKYYDTLNAYVAPQRVAT